MPATFPMPLIVVIPGQLISASLWNGEWDNAYINFTPAGVDDYSATNTEMQTATDPFPASVISRPTSLQGELERIRYILDLIVGKTYWYEHPSIELETLSTDAALIPSGYHLTFFDPAAPPGWTAISNNDLFLRLVSQGSGQGGSTGGSGSTPSAGQDLSHSHTVNSHTHSTPAHEHLLAYTSVASRSVTGFVNSLDIDNGSLQTDAGAGAAATRRINNITQLSGGGTSGAATPTTNSQLTTLAFQYANVIICIKD